MLQRRMSKDFLCYMVKHSDDLDILALTYIRITIIKHTWVLMYFWRGLPWRIFFRNTLYFEMLTLVSSSKNCCSNLSTIWNILSWFSILSFALYMKNKLCLEFGHKIKNMFQFINAVATLMELWLIESNLF